MDVNLKKPLRIALFTDADVFAGTERHIVTLAQGLKDCGVEVSLACPPESPVAKFAIQKQFDLVGIEKRRNFDLGAVSHLANLLRNGALDVIHAHNGRTAFLAAAAKTLARRGRCIATQHFLTPAHTQSKGMHGVMSRISHQWLNRATDHVIAISEAAKSAMLQRQEISPRKISVVYHGIPSPDLTQLSPRQTARSEWKIPASHTLVVCVARLEPEKDIETLLLAMKALSRQPPHIFCAILGEGSQQFRLMRHIHRLGLTQSVALLGFQSDPLSIVNAADIFVLPSLSEPFGLAILEAMALGKPVIATQSGGPLEIVNHQTTGLLVPPSDPQALAKAISSLAKNPEMACDLGRNGATRFRENFTVPRMVAETLRIYQN